MKATPASTGRLVGEYPDVVERLRVCNHVGVFSLTRSLVSPVDDPGPIGPIFDKYATYFFYCDGTFRCMPDP